MAMHFARLENSKRLQRVDNLLADLEWHTTREIIDGANVCAVNSAISELRKNGRLITCKWIDGVAQYRRIA